jgi:hypothetical protein
MSARAEWFEWYVSETGHQCLSTTPIPRRGQQGSQGDYLAERLPKKRRAYEPLVEHTGLFRTFASLADDKDAIVAFADKYGLLLGGNETIFVPLPRGERAAITRDGNLGSVPAERLDTWRAEIAEMRELLALWCAARESDKKKLAAHLKWHGGDVVSYRPAPEHSITEEAIWRRERDPAPMAVGDLIKPALYYLARRVTRRLEGDEERPALAFPALIWDTDKVAPVLVLSPKNLLGALWLQFAQAISGNKIFRECDECSTWFEVSKSAFRVNRMYCSGACKAKAYRRRQEKERRR